LQVEIVQQSRIVTQARLIGTVKLRFSPPPERTPALAQRPEHPSTVKEAGPFGLLHLNQIVGWATTKTGQDHAALWSLRSG
jgi:hypothetical protein